MSELICLRLHPYKDEAGLFQLVGPLVEEPALLFIWPDCRDGWAKRRPYAGRLDELKEVPLAAGANSGWPGAAMFKRGRGRPRGEPTGAVAITLSSEVYIHALKLAASNKQLVTEWILMALRNRMEAEVTERPLPRDREVVRMRVPREALIRYQDCAAARNMTLKVWLAAIVTHAVLEVVSPVVATVAGGSP